jgi:hypothetical protein
MHEISAAQASAGLDPALFEAMAGVYAGIASTSLARTSPEDVESDLAQVLAQLR